jgi:antitoxin component of RelBE/YafQ-DinJ toxin-antitoxin module
MEEIVKLRVTADFKEKIAKVANQKGTTLSKMIREFLEKEVAMATS